jgi:hypothetical protein
MPVIKHEHKGECPLKSWDMGFTEYLIHAAPEILWYNVQDVGSYQGQVYAVGAYKNQIVIYEDYYGSCSYCGAWGEGGEPSDLTQVLEHSNFFTTKECALNYIKKLKEKEKWDEPDFFEMGNAIDEIFISFNKN